MPRASRPPGQAAPGLRAWLPSRPLGPVASAAWSGASSPTWLGRTTLTSIAKACPSSDFAHAIQSHKPDYDSSGRHDGASPLAPTKTPFDVFVLTGGPDGHRAAA